MTQRNYDERGTTSPNAPAGAAGEREESMVDEEMLACGRTVDSVWASLDEEPDAHQAQCPDCRRARRSMQSLSELTTEAREQDAFLAPDPSLRDRVMGFARLQVRRSRALLVDRDGASSLSVSEAALADLVRGIVDARPGTIARRCRVSAGEEPGAGPAPLRVRVGVGITPQSIYAEYERDLRRAVVEALEQQTGLAVRSVDLEIEDVHGIA